MKKYNNSVHSSIKMTPKQASRKSNEKEVFCNIEDRRQKQKPEYRLGDIDRIADMKRAFSKRDSTSWSYQLNTITQISDDTIPSYRMNYLAERYNENLLGKSKVSLKENDVLFLNFLFGLMSVSQIFRYFKKLKKRFSIFFQVEEDMHAGFAYKSYSEHKAILSIKN